MGNNINNNQQQHFSKTPTPQNKPTNTT